MRLAAAFLISSLAWGPVFSAEAAASAPADSARGNTSVTAPAAAPQAPEVAAPASAPVDSAPAQPKAEPALLAAAHLSKLEFGGTAQLKAFYHDMLADRDADKALSLNLRRLRLDFNGALGDHFGFVSQLRVEGNGGNFGIDEGYLSWTANEFFGIRGGKMKRPFSQEELMSSKNLYTVERGQLYQDFLETENGYSGYDLGVLVYGGFEDEGVPVKYEVGLFDGKQNSDPTKNYANQQNEATDKGFRSKDVVFRLSASPFEQLKAEAGVSTKTAENQSDSADFALALNTAYQVGLDFTAKHLRLLGEFAWGDNHQGGDAEIISGSSFFVDFYGMGIWREDYSGGRASELVLKFEGLDRDVDKPNDGKLRYTLGCNYFFTPTTSVLGDYSIVQPLTQIAGQNDLRHSLDVMWRMSF